MRQVIPWAMCLLFLLQGCEQTVDVDFPYEKLIVVNAFVGVEEDPFVWISRTLPATDEPTTEKAAIMDADVKLFWRDTMYQLPPTGPRGFRTPQPDERWGGDSLRMVVEWQGLRAEATARMPVAPTIVKAEFRPSPELPSHKQLFVTLRTRPGCVIWFDYLSFRGDLPTPLSMRDIYRVIPGEPTSPELEVNIGFTAHYQTDRDTIDLVVFVADRVYAQYLDDPSADSDGPFSFGGVGAFTNVRGNGLGMFVPIVTVKTSVVFE